MPLFRKGASQPEEGDRARKLFHIQVPRGSEGAGPPLRVAPPTWGCTPGVTSGLFQLETRRCSKHLKPRSRAGSLARRLGFSGTHLPHPSLFQMAGGASGRWNVWGPPTGGLATINSGTVGVSPTHPEKTCHMRPSVWWVVLGPQLLGVTSEVQVSPLFCAWSQDSSEVEML